MNKMLSFIKQEALEKAREIWVKADKEFAIGKDKLEKQEKKQSRLSTPRLSMKRNTKDLRLPRRSPNPHSPPNPD
ncbi:uncharacterized protein LACBIDRAFT_298889 [Laccaria bicolor S238N-H82]|uniref:Predicted protein n=1 Tax=Laccaria bicolor (strain S238N-H82 / ATCC MYA-4686) TaxID=486041 RepID=B0DE86_LACBS|nr:uncharacterized protein LACBIDRAFT_298889 [Laccaria bicolor S238N-H82]EDR07221.1 predicted protein [Laccaria bicolor S238N-H82]|eukprot:XP_001882152.1 predicted protein [Laccaria bicolor S238N-H82]